MSEDLYFIDAYGVSGKIGDTVNIKSHYIKNILKYYSVFSIQEIETRLSSSLCWLLTLDNGQQLLSIDVVIIDLSDARVLNKYIPI